VPAVPENGNTEPSLMVVLHGRGDVMESYQNWGRELAIPGMSYLLLSAPQEYGPGYSWYDHPPHQLPGILESREKLSQVFRELAHAGIDPARTFLFGFSQGCLMTLEFGARFDMKLGGYIGVSGYSYDPSALLREANPEVSFENGDSWLITHGTVDDVLPVERTRAQMKDFQAAGFGLDYREYFKGHFIDPRKEVADIREWLLERL
jgi:phospholipase/carboxylesterase